MTRMCYAQYGPEWAGRRQRGTDGEARTKMTEKEHEKMAVGIIEKMSGEGILKLLVTLHYALYMGNPEKYVFEYLPEDRCDEDGFTEGERLHWVGTVGREHGLTKTP